MQEKTAWEKIITFIGHPIFQLLVWPMIASLANWFILNWNQFPPVIIWWSTLLVIAVTLVIVNHIYVWKERTRKNFSNYSDKEIENLIRQWIDRPNFKVQRMHKSEAFFSFSFEPSAGNQIVEVVRLKENPAQVFLGVNIEVEDNITKFLTQLPEPSRSDFIIDLGNELTRFGIGFKGLQVPFKALEINEIVPLQNGLTQFYFLNRINYVFRAFNLVNFYLNKFLRNAGYVPPDPKTQMNTLNNMVIKIDGETKTN